MFRKLSLALSFSLLFSSQIMAQVTTATISGVVRDETGAVLPGATVTVRNLDTGITRTVVTDEQGRYHAPNLSLGNYEVQAELAGFQTAVRAGIKLTVGQEAVVDLVLKVGEITEKVVVTGEAPLVETTSSSISGLVDDKKIRDLPLNGRSFTQLALLQAGVVQHRTTSGSIIAGFGSKMSVSGARPNSNNFMLDGTDINEIWNKTPGGVSNNALGVEAVREFRVLTHTYSAEFGRATGGIVNVVTKSGANDLSGSVFIFHRNDNLDARNFFDPVEGPPEFKRNQFGFAVGGPIKKDRTFFFGNYEGLRERLGLTTISRVPNQNARAGLLPDPRRTGELRRVTINPSVLPYLNIFPLPNGRDFGDGRAEFVAPFSQPTDEDYFSIRVDHKLTESDSFFARYTFDDGSLLAPGRQIPQLFPNLDFNRNQYTTLEEQKIITPTLLNTFRFGYNRTRIGEVQAPQIVTPPELSIVPGKLMPQLSISGFSTLGPDDAIPEIFTQHIFEFIDNVVYTKGRHSIKAGMQAQRIQMNVIFETRQRSRWNFASLEDFLLGRSSRMQIAPPALADPHRAFRQSLFGFFLQDDFRVHSRFTLNLGVRYEFTTTLGEKFGRQPTLREEQLATARVEDIITSPPWYENPELKNFAPRFGFAWDLRGNGKTALRGGFGLFYDHILPHWMTIGGWRMFPFYNTLDARNLPFPLKADEIIARLGTRGNQAFHIQFHPRSQYVMHYNLNLQRELLTDFVLSVGYQGSRGVGLGRIIDVNRAVPIQILADGRPVYSTRPERLNPNFESMNLMVTDSNSFYHAMVLSANKRFSHGYQFQVSYTMSKLIDEAAGVRTAGDSNAEGGTLSRDFRHFDRGLSSYHVGHNLVMNFTYDLPGKNISGAAGKALGGWQLNAIATISSGFPFTVSQGTNSRTALLDGERRPDLVVGGSNNPVLGGPDRYFDPRAFSFAAPEFLGTLGRNTVVGPGVANFDFSLVKNFAISEAVRLQFRAEFFNLFNRPNFGLPERNVFDGRGSLILGAGRITETTTTSRQVQFGLKLEF